MPSPLIFRLQALCGMASRLVHFLNRTTQPMFCCSIDCEATVLVARSLLCTYCDFGFAGIAPQSFAIDTHVSSIVLMSERLWLLHPEHLIRSGPHKSCVSARTVLLQQAIEIHQVLACRDLCVCNVHITVGCEKCHAVLAGMCAPQLGLCKS